MLYRVKKQNYTDGRRGPQSSLPAANRDDQHTEAPQRCILARLPDFRMMRCSSGAGWGPSGTGTERQEQLNRGDQHQRLRKRRQGHHGRKGRRAGRRRNRWLRNRHQDSPDGEVATPSGARVAILIRVALGCVDKKLDQTALGDHEAPKMRGTVRSGLRNMQKDIGVNSVGKSQFLVKVATFSIVRDHAVTNKVVSGSVCNINRGLTVFKAAQLPLEIDVVRAGLVTSSSKWRLREGKEEHPHGGNVEKRAGWQRIRKTSGGPSRRNSPRPRARTGAASERD
mmetsp:Transcript_93228/g.250128  ORF Transcript_93228/g.250128 Transcript_93228/m.250128 type:complete len:282 (+) Transcript_93228:109-954(+)